MLVAVHAAVLWLWHAPGLYTWGLASVPAYWLMQVSLLGSAWLLWRAILAPTQPGAALIALAATIGQMGLLGALIVFAPQAALPRSSGKRGELGTGPLTDQQLAGLLMWVPAMLPYLGVGLWIAWSSLQIERTSAVTTFLKFVHLGAIALWSGGLIALPFLFWQRRALEPGLDLDRLHRVTRFVYVELTSPAAFVAIGSGTALIFLQATFAEWFSLKMVLVGDHGRCCTWSPASSSMQLFLPNGPLQRGVPTSR